MLTIPPKYNPTRTEPLEVTHPLSCNNFQLKQLAPDLHKYSMYLLPFF